MLVVVVGRGMPDAVPDASGGWLRLRERRLKGAAAQAWTRPRPLGCGSGSVEARSTDRLEAQSQVMAALVDRPEIIGRRPHYLDHAFRVIGLRQVHLPYSAEWDYYLRFTTPKPRIVSHP